MKTFAQRWIFSVALLLIVAGVLFGFVYTYIVEHSTLAVLRESYSTGFIAAAEGQRDTTQIALKHAEVANYRCGRMVDVHTHLIKLASVLLLGGLLYPLIAFSDRHKRTLAAVFVVGACLFPLGVWAEIYWNGRVPQAIAACGALLVIVSFGGLVLGLLRGIQSQETRSEM